MRLNSWRVKNKELGIRENLFPKHVAVKEAVFPFVKLPGVDPVLGPEMKSTGEVMGIDYDFGMAYYKAELAAGTRLPTKGRVVITVKKSDRKKILPVARKFAELGFEILATRGTAEFLRSNGIEAKVVNKVSESRPNILDMIVNKEVDLIINTPSGKRGKTEGYAIRRAAVDYNVPYITIVSVAAAAVKSIERMRNPRMTIKSLQEYHEEGGEG